MWKDPIVEEVRSIREKQAESLGFDIRKIVEDAKAKQRTSGHPLVSFVKGRRSPRPKRRVTRS
ncbi:MAG: hypothetical protein M1376_04250 [Planctomycetes bacterium]|nr:hypothetical protein [Planctomycetota bacterium]